uniref:Uncharacterized protein n=1 Tax=Takifugu rubripes TaxID=31033 RepID=A0A674MVY2_TAKRU
AMEIENSRPYFFGDIGCWSERTEVHRAASQGHAAQLQHLIQSGASVNMVAVDSITPLHEACVRGQAECVQLLLEAGAQVDARNVDGSTPLCDACSAGSLECVRLLLEHGAKANTALTSRTASPLHEACMGGNADCVKLLIAVDAGLEAYDLYYGTPLHVACANDDINCVKVLLNAGAKVNAARLHETPLHHAAKNMRVEMIEILVEFGANVYARDQHNRKPVYYTTPGSPSAGCLSFYESKSRSSDRFPRMGSPAALQVGAEELAGSPSSKGHRPTTDPQTPHQIPLLPVSPGYRFSTKSRFTSGNPS